ncbi:MAG: hypothetical protein ABR899_02515 [Candidatus Krumholzibacteriaceae bacterium]|jgi:hypothetical protein
MASVCIPAERIKLENELRGYKQHMTQAEVDEFVDSSLEAKIRDVPASQTRGILSARARLTADLKRSRGL